MNGRWMSSWLSVDDRSSGTYGSYTHEDRSLMFARDNKSVRAKGFSSLRGLGK